MSEPSTNASVARRLRDAIEPIAMHPVWCSATRDALAAQGLDFFPAYVWGRAAALGEPAPAVVVASFAAFEPSLISSGYETGRTACSRDLLLSTRIDATTASLTEVLDGVEFDLTGAASRLRDAAMDLDQSGRALYAGLAAIPMSDDPLEILWRSAELIREHRGDSHVAACVAAGLDPISMNILTELWVGYDLGEYSGTRGWDAADIATCAARLRAEGLLDGERLSAEGLAFRRRIEDATDAAQAVLVDRLGGDVDGLIADLDRWSQRCIDVGAFPANASKRAAG
jgi:hypothetical protein